MEQERKQKILFTETDVLQAYILLEGTQSVLLICYELNFPVGVEEKWEIRDPTSNKTGGALAGEFVHKSCKIT